MSDPIDASREKRVDWDKEVEAGNLLRQDPSRSNRTQQGEHCQGVPITDANREGRIISGSRAKDMMEQAQSSPNGAFRAPAPSGGKISAAAPKGGWPRFGPDGSIIREPHI